MRRARRMMKCLALLSNMKVMHEHAHMRLGLVLTEQIGVRVTCLYDDITLHASDSGICRTTVYVIHTRSGVGSVVHGSCSQRCM